MYLSASPLLIVTNTIATLICRVNNLNKLITSTAIEWTKENNTLFLGQSLTKSDFENYTPSSYEYYLVSVLKINTTINDSATYKCQFTYNNVKYESKEVTLIVEGKILVCAIETLLYTICRSLDSEISSKFTQSGPKQC